MFPVSLFVFAIAILYFNETSTTALKNGVLLFAFLGLIWRLYIYITRGNETYTVSETGISISRWQGTIKWHDLHKVMTYPTPFGSYILFILKDDVRLKSNRRWPFGWFDRLNGGIGAGQVWFSTLIFTDKHENMLAATFDAFCAGVPDVRRNDKECYVEV